MNKRITSLLLCFLMVFGMLATTAEHTHAASKPTVSMEANKATANAGDEVEITIYFQSPIDSVGGQLSVVLPEGISFVSCNIENATSDMNAMMAVFQIKQALGMGDGDLSWDTATMQIFFTSDSPFTNIKNAPVAMAVLKCKIADDAASGTYNISFTTTIDGIVGQGGIGNGTGDMLAASEYDLVGTSIQVVGKSVAIDSITLDATELELVEGETATLTATINPSNQSEGFVWTTDDSSVASITGDTATVTITAGKAGTATITIAGKEGSKSATCVVTVTCKHEWSTTLVNNDPAGHYYECGKCGEKKDNAAHTAADDGNCMTADLCSCGYTVRAAGDHTPEADDGNCQTPVSCKNCDQIAVAAKTHVAAADDGDCTTAVLCANEGCKAEVTAAKSAHEAGADDGDCTTAVKCANCDKNAVEAEQAHTAGADDGDCTTAVKCTKCDKDAVAAKDAHVADEDDGDCTTAVKCTNCDKEVVAAKDAHVAGEDDGDCTTAVKCVNCDKNAVEAEAKHTAGADDGDCTTAVKCTKCDKDAIAAGEHTPAADDGDCSTAVKCSNCDHVVVEAKQHDFSGEWNNDKAEGHYHACGNEGCEAIDEFVEHVPGPEATPSKPQVCTECGYELAPATNKFVKSVEATVAKPVIGQAPSFEVTVKSNPSGTVELDYIEWYKIAKEEYTGTNEDNWIEMAEGEVFEEGYIYSCDIFLHAAEDYELDANITGKVNGKAHDDSYGGVDNGDGGIYLAQDFKPIDPNNPETGDNSNMMLWIAMLVLSGVGVIGAFAYDKKKKRA